MGACTGQAQVGAGIDTSLRTLSQISQGVDDKSPQRFFHARAIFCREAGDCPLHLLLLPHPESLL